MKLPQDPKERFKILFLVGIGVAGVIFTLVTLVIKPLNARKAKYREEIAVATDALSAAQRDVNRMMEDRDANSKVLARIVEGAYHTGYVLKPRLGMNYELGAREFVEGVAQAVGITMDSIKEIGITQMPQPPAEKDYKRALKCYNLSVQFTAGLHDTARLLTAIEDGNPYLCVSSVSVSSRSEDPARHAVTLELQWPVWADPDLGQQLEQRLEDARTFVPSEAPQPPPT